MLKEARFEAEGYDGLQQLREVYNVEVDCYANFNVFPGAKIYVDGEYIDGQMYQRSGDMFLGVPFNIASYSFLLHIISKITGYKPGKFIHIIGDAHIYEDHLSGVKEQLTRVPSEYPELVLSEEVKNIDTLDESMFQIKNYRSYGKISAHMIA